MPGQPETLKTRLVMVIYSLAIHLVCLLALPWLLLRAYRTGKLKEGFSERFGFLHRPWVDEVAPGRPIWIHAVSVGEAQMLGPLLVGLKETFPGTPVVVSTGTVPGQTIAGTFCEVDGTFFLPLDLGWALRRLIRTLRPRLLLILETEIWPNLIVQASRQGVPVLFMNGRISDRSFDGYQRARPFLSLVLQFPAWFGMQSEINAVRIEAIGAPADRVRVIGNLKYESALHLLGDEEPFDRAVFGLSPDSMLLIGGSTFPGEEEMLIRVYRKLRESFPSLRLLIAPRHPQRFEEAKQVVRDSGLPLACRSQGSLPVSSEPEPPVILLDVMGELKRVYRLADAVFIGKSMRFSTPGCGGQNPLEPAVWSKPILSGPSMENFREVVEALREFGGILQVESEQALCEELAALLADPDLRAERGKAAFSVIGNSQGAVERCLELVRETLEDNR